MRATLAADLATAAGEIDAEVPADLRERLGELFEMRSIQVLTDPPSLAWLARAMVMVDPGTGRRRMVGSVGFHAPPSGEPPHVEIGYHVEPEFRRRGLATEAVRAMLDWAAEQGIHRFRATVAPTNAAVAGHGGPVRLPAGRPPLGRGRRRGARPGDGLAAVGRGAGLNVAGSGRTPRAKMRR